MLAMVVNDDAGCLTPAVFSSTSRGCSLLQEGCPSDFADVGPGPIQNVPEGQLDFRQIARWIVEVVDGLAKNGEDNGAVEAKVKAEVEALCARFPLYAGM